MRAVEAARASAPTAAEDGSWSLVGCAHDDDSSRGVAVAGTHTRRPRMTVDVDSVIIVALTVLLPMAEAEAGWQRGRRARAAACVAWGRWKKAPRPAALCSTVEGWTQGEARNSARR
jgi:hypothetical protein